MFVKWQQMNGTEITTSIRNMAATTMKRGRGRLMCSTWQRHPWYAGPLSRRRPPPPYGALQTSRYCHSRRSHRTRSRSNVPPRRMAAGRIGISDAESHCPGGSEWQPQAATVPRPFCSALRRTRSRTAPCWAQCGQSSVSMGPRVSSPTRCLHG